MKIVHWLIPASGSKTGKPLRREIEGGWVAYGGLSVSQLVGPAAHSPITLQRTGLSGAVGLGRRF